MRNLHEAETACEEDTKTNDEAVPAQADVAFHDIIIKAAGNDRLTALVNNLAEQMYRYRFEYIKDARNHIQIITEHRQIYESLYKKNRAEAAQAVKTHIDNQEQMIVQMIHLEN